MKSTICTLVFLFLLAPYISADEEGKKLFKALGLKDLQLPEGVSLHGRIAKKVGFMADGNPAFLTELHDIDDIYASLHVSTAVA